MRRASKTQRIFLTTPYLYGNKISPAPNFDGTEMKTLDACYYKNVSFSIPVRQSIHPKSVPMSSLNFCILHCKNLNHQINQPFSLIQPHSASPFSPTELLCRGRDDGAGKELDVNNRDDNHIFYIQNLPT